MVHQTLLSSANSATPAAEAAQPGWGPWAWRPLRLHVCMREGQWSKAIWWPSRISAQNNLHRWTSTMCVLTCANSAANSPLTVHPTAAPAQWLLSYLSSSRCAAVASAHLHHRLANRLGILGSNATSQLPVSPHPTWYPSTSPL